MGITYFALPAVEDAPRSRSPVHPDTLAMRFPALAVATPIRDCVDSAAESWEAEGAVVSGFSEAASVEATTAGGETRADSCKPPDISEGGGEDPPAPGDDPLFPEDDEPEADRDDACPILPPPPAGDDEPPLAPAPMPAASPIDMAAPLAAIALAAHATPAAAVPATASPPTAIAPVVETRSPPLRVGEPPKTPDINFGACQHRARKINAPPATSHADMAGSC